MASVVCVYRPVELKGGEPFIFLRLCCLFRENKGQGFVLGEGVQRKGTEDLE